MEVRKNYTVTSTEDDLKVDLKDNYTDDLVYHAPQLTERIYSDLPNVDRNRVIAFIPVRGGSKSIPLKNIKNFCGKPLVYWVIEELQKCEEVTDIVVATDSDEIEECVWRLDDTTNVSVFRRSREVSTDTATTESVILEYLGATYLEVDKSKGETKLGKALEHYSLQDLKECVFIGDDLFDIDLLREVGYAFCPNDAHEDVKRMKNVIKLKIDGGRGVVSEVLRYFK